MVALENIGSRSNAALGLKGEWAQTQL